MAADPELPTRLTEDDPAHGRPRLSAPAAARLARDAFGVDGSATPLPGERDRSFRVRAAAGEFVLRVVHPDAGRAALDLQARALERVAASPAAERSPRFLPARSGAIDAEVVEEGGRRCVVRLATWLPGRPLAEVTPHPHRVFHELGAHLAHVDRALAGQDDAPAAAAHGWDLCRGTAFPREAAGAIADPARRSLLDALLRRLDARVAIRRDLPRQLVHGDANDHNVLVMVDPETGPRFAGLIDFGDLTTSYRASEPAVAAAYCMLGKQDPLAAAAAVVAGYHQVAPLATSEVDALFDLALLRLVISVTLSASRRAGGAGEPYLAVSEAPAWELLARLADCDAGFATAVLCDACGLPPTPTAVAVRRWLEEHGETAHPVLDGDLAGARIVDLAVDGEAEEGPAPGERAIGRVGEVRLCYEGALYDVPADVAVERRTVHLGIDLFAPAGTPVRAPLAGVVHSVADNRGALDYGPTVLLRHDVDGVRFHTLYGHLARAAVARLRPGDEIPRGHPFAALGTADENGGWPPHVHFQIVLDPFGRQGEFPGVAAPSALRLWQALSPPATLLLPGLPAAASAPPPLPLAETLARHARHAPPALHLHYRRPLRVVRGRGAFLYDDGGQAYLDAVNNVSHVGHAHPRVVQAGQRQLARVATNARYVHDVTVAYVERLAALFPAPLEVVFLVNSGSEANELALRLVYAHTGRRDLVVLEGGYHGNTPALIEASPYKHRGPGGSGTPPHVHVAPLPDGTGAGAAAALGAILAGMTARGRPPAAFLAESLPSCAGQIVPPRGYLSAAYRHVRAHGGLCIADEVQVGFGRVGPEFWGFALDGAVPDVVTLGKSIGNGYPLGAVVTTAPIARALGAMEWFSTYGGNPVATAIGTAVLDVLADEGLPEQARRTGDHLLAGLRGLAARHPILGDVRGRGLFAGVELVQEREQRTPAPAAARYLVERGRERGILWGADGIHGNVLKFKPPMVFGPQHADRLVVVLDGLLSETAIRESLRREAEIPPSEPR